MSLALRKSSFAATLLLVLGAQAQTQTSAAEKPAEPAVATSDSPRTVVNQFLEDVRLGRDSAAAAFLDLAPTNGPKKKGDKTQPEPTKVDAAELARQLAAVLQNQPTFDVDLLSDAPEGNTDDGLAADQEDIASVVTHTTGLAAPVRLLRHVGAVPAWKASASTVALIPIWYERTGHAWVRENLPSWFSKRGPAGVQFWQWLALLLTIVLAWLVGFIVSRLLSRVAGNLTQRTKTQWDDAILHRVQAPVTFACSLAVGSAILPWLDLPQSTEATLFRVIKGGFLVVFFWLCVRGVDTASELIAQSRLAHNRPASRSLLSLGARFAKALLFTILVIAVLSQLGFPVASLLAGLGIGGLAVALAGQKTLENLIGTFAIGFDQPFREGDFVKVRDIAGTVETIGLRSTRIRTLDRTLVTLPNGKLADEQVETISIRDRFRLFLALPIRYGASAEAIQRALSHLEAELKEYANVQPTSVSVRLSAMESWSMTVEVAAMLDTPDGDIFGKTRQAVLLRALQILAEAGVEVQPSVSASLKGGPLDAVTVRETGNGKPRGARPE